MLATMRTANSPSVTGQGVLPPPFDSLVAENTLTEKQARAVLDALAARAAPTTEPPPSGGGKLLARLAEVGAYLGAGLVVAAGIVVVAQQWSDMSYAVRVGVMAGVSVVLVVAGLVPVMLRRGRPWDGLAYGQTQRRLSGTLLTMGAAAGYATVLVAMLSEQANVTEDEAGWASIIGAALAFAILMVARLQADTPLGEIGMFASATAAYIGLIQIAANDRTVLIQWTLLALGLTWAGVATFTRLMRHQQLITCLGLLEAFFAAATIAESAWSQRLALAVLIAVSLAVYLSRPSWPYITTATLGAVVLTVTWVGEAVGPAVAMLTAGVVLLLLAGGALVLRKRRLEMQSTGTGG